MKKMRILSLLVCVIALVSLCCLCAGAETAPADVYVDTKGQDTNAGTEGAPVQSLNKALELVRDGGTVHIVDSYTAPSDFKWENHNKDVTITGGTLDLSQVGTKVTADDKTEWVGYHQGDAVTYDSISLIFADKTFYFADGFRLQINENVTVTGKEIYLFGGGYNGHTVSGTDVKLLSGSYLKVYGGGYKANVDGDIRVFVGNINAKDTVDHDTATRLFGGGYRCNVSGDIDVTIAGAKIGYATGGNESASANSAGNITVRMTGGQLYSLYAGHRSANSAVQTGNISLTITGGKIAQAFGANNGGNHQGNVTVRLEGGEFTRRFFGGCYNDYAILVGYKTDYHVIGNVNVYIYENVNFSWSESDREGLYACSRYTPLFEEEVTNIYFADQAAKNKWENKLKVSGTVMGSTEAADTISVLGATSSAVEKYNVVLGDDIGANFAMKIPEEVAKVAVVKVTVAGRTKTYDISKQSPNAEGQYVVSANVEASQMTEDITLQLVLGGTEHTLTSFTVRGYAEEILGGNYTQEAKNLVKRMLNYGAAAQVYFGKNTGNLANKGYEESYEAQLPEGYTTVGRSGKVSGLKIVGATLVFKSKITLRYIFEAESLEGVSFKANGKTYTATEKNGQYYVDIPGINPDKYAENVVLYATKGEETLSVTYSPMHYIVRMHSKTENPAMKALVNAMYGYHETAVIYVGKTGATVTLPTVTGGKVTTDKTSYLLGQTVILTATPDANYNLVSLVVKKNGVPVSIGDVTFAGGIYTFPAESGNYTVECEFKEKIFAEEANWDLTEQYNGKLVITERAGEYTGITTTSAAYRDAAVTVKDFTQYEDATAAGDFQLQIRFIFENGRQYQIRLHNTVKAGQYEVQSMGDNSGVCITGWKWHNNFDPTQSQKMQSEGVTFRVALEGTNAVIYVDGTKFFTYNIATQLADAGIDENSKAQVRFVMYGNNGQTDVEIPFTLGQGAKADVSVAEVTNGSVATDKASYFADETVKLTATPDEGYYLKSLVVKKNGQEVDVGTIDLNGGTYTFTAEEGNYTVEAAFAKKIFQDSANWDLSKQDESLITVLQGADKQTIKTYEKAYRDVTLTLQHTVGEIFKAEIYFHFDSKQFKIRLTNEKGYYGIQNMDGSAFSGWPVLYSFNEDETKQLQEEGITFRVAVVDTHAVVYLNGVPVELKQEINLTGVSATEKAQIEIVMYGNDGERYTIPYVLSESPATATVEAAGNENGTVSTDKTIYAVGEKVKLAATPAEGYHLTGLTLKKDGQIVKTFETAIAGGEYTFVAEEGAYTVEAAFAKKIFQDNENYDLAEQHKGNLILKAGQDKEIMVITEAGVYRGAAVTVSDLKPTFNENGNGNFQAQIRFIFAGNEYHIRLHNTDKDGKYKLQNMGNTNCITGWSWVADLTDAQTEKLQSEEGVQFRVVLVGNCAKAFIDDKLMGSVDLSTGNITEDTTAQIRFAMCGNVGVQNMEIPFLLTEEQVAYSTVEIAGAENGAVKTDKAILLPGEKATLTVTPNEGYYVKSLTVVNGNETVAVSKNSFVAGEEIGTYHVSVVFAKYTTVEISGTENGSVTADKERYTAGETVTITATPNNEGYNLKSLVVKKNGQAVDIGAISMAGGTYTFTAEEGNYTVEAAFAKKIFLDAESWDLSKQDEDILSLPQKPEKEMVVSTVDAIYRDAAVTVKDYQEGAFQMQIRFVFGSKIYQLRLHNTDSDRKYRIQAIGSGSNIVGWNAIKKELTAAQTEKLLGDGLQFRIAMVDTVAKVYLDGQLFATHNLTEAFANNGLQASDMAQIQFAMVGNNGKDVAFSYALGGEPAKATVAVTGNENGTVTIDQPAYVVGETVKLTATPDEGYYLKSLVVKKNGQAVDIGVISMAGGTYTFTAEEGNYTVEAAFAKKIFLDAESWDLSKQDEDILSLPQKPEKEMVVSTVDAIYRDAAVTVKDYQEGAFQMQIRFVFGSKIYQLRLHNTDSDRKYRIQAIGSGSNIVGWNAIKKELTAAQTEKLLGDGLQFRIAMVDTVAKVYLDGQLFATHNLTEAFANNGLQASDMAQIQFAMVGNNGKDVAFSYALGGEPAKATVAVTGNENGTVTVDQPAYVVGETVTVTAAPADGYNLKSLKLKKDGQVVETFETTFAGGSYTFTAEEGSYTVEAQIPAKLFNEEGNWDLTKQYEGRLTIPAKGSSSVGVTTTNALYREASVTVQDFTQYEDATAAGNFQMQIRFIFENGRQYQIRLHNTVKAGQYEVQSMGDDKGVCITGWKWHKNFSSAQSQKMQSEGVTFRVVLDGTNVVIYVDGTKFFTYDLTAAVPFAGSGVDANSLAQVRFVMYGNNDRTNVEIPFTLG